MTRDEKGRNGRNIPAHISANIPAHLTLSLHRKL